MQKINFKKELKHLYNSSKKVVEIVEVPPLKFFMIDGTGNPNTSQDYKDAIEALYALSYTCKFMIKKGGLEIDYGVMPLEGLWWTDDMTDFSIDNKDIWKWTAMMMQPEYVTEEIYNNAIEQVKQKKNPVALSKLRFDTYEEGKCAQIMHIGPFSEEGPTIQKIHDFIIDKGEKLRGIHHEIYLSDIRKAAPEKWKTVIRQPMT